MKEPKDLGLKLGSKEMKLWEGVVKETQVLVEQHENNIIVTRAMLELAERKLAEATEKFKY